MRRLEYRWVILSSGFAVLFFGTGSRFAFGLVLKPMSEDLGWTRSTLSLAATTFFVVSALSMPLMGRLMDRYNLRYVIAVAALIAAVGIWLMSGASLQWQIFALYGVVYAIGNAGMSVASIGVMISRWFVRRRGIANSAAISGTAAGQLVIITLLATFLPTLGWRGAFFILGAVNLIIVVPLILVFFRSHPPSEDSGDQSAALSQSNHDGVSPDDDATLASSSVSVSQVTSETSTSVIDIFRSRKLWLLLAVYGMCGFQDFFVATHVVAFADDQGVGSRLAGNMLALMGLMGVFGVLASGLLADSFGAARPLALCFLLRVAIFASIIFFQSTPGILIFALLYGFTFMITAPLTVVFAGNIFGAARLGVVSGVIIMTHQIFGGLGAFVGAFIFDTWGSYDRAFILMFGIASAAFVIALMVRDKPATSLTEQANTLKSRGV